MNAKMKALLQNLEDEIYFLSEIADGREISLTVADRLRRRVRALERLLKAIDP